MKTVLRAGTLVGEIAPRGGLDAPGARFTSALEAAQILARFAREPLNLHALRRLIRVDCHLETARSSDAEILDLVAQQLAAGRLSLTIRRVEPLPVWSVNVPEDAPAPVERGAPVKEKTWIEIELLDMEGNPVRGEPYWIGLPDGSVREGRLDDRGRAYIGDIDPGVCEVRWPRLDDSATQSPATARRRDPAAVVSGQVSGAAGGDPARATAERAVAAEERAAWGRAPAPFTAPRRERDWIEIELLDMDDQPVPGEAYWIKLTDGSIREGKLDNEGRAYFGDLDAGICEVRWPDLDNSAADPPIGASRAVRAKLPSGPRQAT